MVHSSDIPLAQVLDVATIETDLADVEIALERLENGTYWTDEVTGAPLPDELLAARPTARRASAPSTASPTSSSSSSTSPATGPSGLASAQGNESSPE